MNDSITKHQRETLKTLIALSGRGRFYVDAKDSGAPAALEHLFRKGYVDRRIEYGPRGGEHRGYRPTTKAFRRLGVQAHEKASL